MTPPSGRKRVPRVLISGGLAVGGPQTHVSLLCRALREAGADVTIAASATNWPETALQEIRDLGVRVLVPRFGFGALRAFGKAEAFVTWPWRLGRLYNTVYCIGEGRMHSFTRRFRTREGLSIYHEIVDCPGPGSSRARVAAQMNGLIGNSALIGEQLSQLFPRLPVRVISFLTADATSEPVRPACLPGQKLRVAFLGRLVSHKRPDKLVECWGSMLAKGALSPAELQIHGGNFGNEMASALEERILALGLQKVVQLHGEYTHSELPSILAGTDIVVLPSLYEGLPLVLVEAMKHGIPVVATAAGGTSELRNDNPDVIITPGTDWSEFEQGLQQMAARVRSGKVDSTRLRRWASDRYGYSGLAQEWCDALMKPESWDLPRERVKFERDG